MYTFLDPKPVKKINLNFLIFFVFTLLDYKYFQALAKSTTWGPLRNVCLFTFYYKTV